ncbi:flagellar motor protein MotB, partial [mine drainage metagenome]
MNGTASNRRIKHSHGDGEHQESGQERWLLTYADMITLLLVLFIVLYAISTIDQAKYQEFKQSVTRALLSQVPHGTTNLNQNSTAKSTNENTQANQQTNQLVQIEQKLASALNAKGLLGDVTFTINSSGLVEGLVADSTFFGSDLADLTPQGKE